MTEQSPQPSSPADASVKLAGLVADPQWSSKLLAGDGAAKTEFDSLSAVAAGITVAKPIDMGAAPVAEELAARLAAAKAAAETTNTGLSPEAALSRLEKIKADPKFLARLTANEAEAIKEFQELHEIAVNSDHEAAKFADALVFLQTHGLPDLNSDVGKDIVNMASGKTSISLALRRQAETKYQTLMRDRTFCDRYLSGDAEASRVMLTVNAIRSANVTAEAA